MKTFNNLAQFKKVIAIGDKVRITNHVKPELSRDTTIVHIQSNSMAFDMVKNVPGFGPTNVLSWVEYPKAINFVCIDNKAHLCFKDGSSMIDIEFID